MEGPPIGQSPLGATILPPGLNVKTQIGIQTGQVNQITVAPIQVLKMALLLYKCIFIFLTFTISLCAAVYFLFFFNLSRFCSDAPPDVLGRKEVNGNDVFLHIKLLHMFTMSNAVFQRSKEEVIAVLAVVVVVVESKFNCRAVIQNSLKKCAG